MLKIALFINTSVNLLLFSSCSLFQAGETLIDTAYKAGKYESEAEALDAINKLQGKLNQCIERKNCTKKFVTDLKKNVSLAKEDIAKLKKKVEKAVE